jgi:putative nucleotidyltransferase with HDIG domain
LEALTSALAARDYDTQSHCYRTVELTVALARVLGVDEDDLPAMARGALLHDIGKIGISDNILFKPGALTPQERETMKSHARLGHEMLRHIPFFQDALPIVLHHHEQYDGSGYPLGLSGQQIPRGARIFHVVDLYDALTQERPYKSAWTHEAAIAEVQRLSGRQCDAEVVTALAALNPEITARIRNLRDFSPDVRELLGRQID